MITGTVKSFDRVKGFGFIVVDGVAEDVFVHHSGIEGEGYRNLNAGDAVNFDPVRHVRRDGSTGTKAVNVRVTQMTASDEYARQGGR